MRYELTAQQQLVKAEARKFAEEDVAPRAAELDRSGAWPYDTWEKMSRLGYAGFCIPERYGGAGSSVADYVLLLEEVARADDGFAAAYQIQQRVSNTILLFASEEQKATYLPVLARGERIAAYALTEVNAGSDLGGLETRAVLKEGEWLINGSKAFIANAGLENSLGVLLLAVTGERDDGNKELSSILVPRDAPGFSVDYPIEKIGWNVMDTRELTFDNCRVPEGNLIGVRGQGLAHVLEGLSMGQIAFSAIGAGIAQAALDCSLQYAQTRVQFGKPIGKFQAIQAKLAEMAVNVEIARLHAYKTAWLKDRGLPYSSAATIAKLASSEMAVKNVSSGFQIHGGYGFVDKYPISRLYRSVKMMEIAESTSELCRLAIAEDLGC